MHDAELLANLRALVLVLDRWGTVLRADGARDGFLGHRASDFPGRNALEFVAADDLEHVASIFAGGGDWILSTTPAPFPVRIVGADGAVGVVECLPARVADDRWVVTLTPGHLQFSTYHALDLYLDGAGPLAVATGVAARAQGLWPDGEEIETFVLHCGAGSVLSEVEAAAPSPLADAVRRCLDDPAAPWNTATTTWHRAVERDELPDVLAATAHELGFRHCDVGVVSLDARCVIAIVMFGTHPSAFEGSTRVIHTKAIAMIEASAQRARVEQILRNAAETDHLTGLSNRAAFEAALGRCGGDDGVAMLFVDIDRFKAVNDTYGHAVGDAVLVEVGRRISATLRAHDVVARFGGDEFAVLLANVDATTAERIGHRIMARIAEPLPADLGPVHVTASVGVAAGVDGDELIDAADLAMLAGKRAGRSTLIATVDRRDRRPGQPPIAR